MIVNVYKKEVDVRDEAVQIYEEFFHEPFTDMIALYMAESIECHEEDDPSAEEIARAIEQNIVDHIKIYEGAAKALSGLDREKDAQAPWEFGYAEA